MQHVAIDLGGKESQICVRAPDGTIVEEKRYPTRLLDKLIKGWPQSRVIVETSAEAFRVADGQTVLSPAERALLAEWLDRVAK